MSSSDITIEQRETLYSFKKLDNHIYLCNYQNDYNLNEIVSSGCDNLKGLIKFCSKDQSIAKRYLKIKIPGFGCTSFNGISRNDDYLLARNFDFKDSPCLVLWTAPKNGYKSIGLIDMNFLLYGYKYQKPDEIKSNLKVLMAPFCCTDGVNEKGLSIAVLEIKTKSTKQTTGKTPITTTVMVRNILDKCADVNEAVEMFRYYDMNDPLFCNYHYHIIDKSGKSVIIEYVNNEMRIIDDAVTENNGISCQALANFFLSEDGDNEKAMGYNRYDIVKNSLLKSKGIYSEKEAMHILNLCNLNYHKLCYQVTTLWSGVYNSSKSTVDICAGMDYSKQYRFDVEKPMQYEMI